MRKQRANVGKGYDYVITEMGQELAPVVMTIGTWGQKYIIKELAKHELDPGLLMWDIHRRIDVSRLPVKGRFVAEFHLSDAPPTWRAWWVIVEDGGVDLCVQAPGRDVDIYVEGNLKSLTEVWMGGLSVDDAKRKKLLILKGNGKYVRSFKDWFALSVFAEFAPVIPSSRRDHAPA